MREELYGLERLPERMECITHTYQYNAITFCFLEEGVFISSTSDSSFFRHGYFFSIPLHFTAMLVLIML